MSMSRSSMVPMIVATPLAWSSLAALSLRTSAVTGYPAARRLSRISRPMKPGPTVFLVSLSHTMLWSYQNRLPEFKFL